MSIVDIIRHEGVIWVPKVRNGGYIPFFITERKRCEAELVQVVQEAFVQGVSTQKMEKLAKSRVIEGISRSQVKYHSNHSTTRQRDVASGKQGCELDLTVPTMDHEYVLNKM